MSAPIPGKVIQVCARCGTRWQVQQSPAQWCPRCRGVLSAPMAAASAPAQQRRAYRWVARRPDAGRPSAPAATAVPRNRGRYGSTPQWGLVDPPPPTPKTDDADLAGLGRHVVNIFTLTAILFFLAAVAEVGRYAILLRNRTRLIDPLLLAASDTAVLATSILALLVTTLAVFAAAGWLIGARRRAFERDGRRDPRPVEQIVMGCIIPGANLIFPGVFLTEITRDALPRTRRLVVVWWCAWVFGAVVALVALVWRFRTTLQAEADGVLLNAFADLVAAGVAIVTILVIRELDDQDVLGRRRAVKRWLVATGPATHVIAPVRPAERPEPTAGAGSDGAQQEVMAK
ncbi:DUF4328 domain-containing protein [Antrihabitans sp. NCIMB 15449]|uniref:DUF4328 domain-containing protein n=1 Tax=Antrihabitans spumae TaxID=3373370 RepID=A0ABW7JVW7_9NOCA